MSRKRYKVSARILDKRGRVLSEGHNSYTKTHPLQALHAKRVGLPHKCFLHAEIHAIARCKQLDRAHRIIVERYDEDGNPRCAQPCPVCERAILESGIKRVEFTC